MVATGRFANIADVTTLQFAKGPGARGFFFFARDEKAANALHARLSQPTRSPYTTAPPRSNVVPMWFGDWTGRERERAAAEACLE